MVQSSLYRFSKNYAIQTNGYEIDSIFLLGSFKVTTKEITLMIQAIIKFGCIMVNISGKSGGNIIPSGAVLVPGISNAGMNIPQKHKGLNPINNFENTLPLSLYFP